MTLSQGRNSEALQIMRLENGTVKTMLFPKICDHHKFQSTFAVFFFFPIYSITMMGNQRWFLLITNISHFHTPVYFSLCMLSFTDTCYSSIIVSKLLFNLISEKKTISCNGCAACLCFYSLWLTQNFSSWLQWLMQHSALHHYYVQDDLLPVCTCSITYVCGGNCWVNFSHN